MQSSFYPRGTEGSYGGNPLYPVRSNQFGGGGGYQDYSANSGFGGGFTSSAPMRGFVSPGGRGGARGGGAERGRGNFQNHGAERGRGRGFGGDRGRGADRGRGRGGDRGRGGESGRGGNRAGGMGMGGFDLGAQINSWEDLKLLQAGDQQSNSGGWKPSRGRGQFENRGARGGSRGGWQSGNRGGGQSDNRGRGHFGNRGGGQFGNRGGGQFGNRGGGQFGNRGGGQFGNRGRGQAGSYQGGEQYGNRGGSVKKVQTRGPGYTAEQALADSPWMCTICDLKVTGPSNLTDHLLGSKHKTAVDAYVLQAAGGSLPGHYLFCSLCNAPASNHDNLMSHLKGQKHQANLLNYGKSGGASYTGPPPVKIKESVLGTIAVIKEPLIGLEFVTEFLHLNPPQDPHYECKVCDLVLIGGNLAPHLMGHKHRLKYMQNHRTHFYETFIKPIWDNFEEEAGHGDARREEEKARNSTMQAKLKEVAVRIEAMDGRKRVKSVTVRGASRPTQTKAGSGSLNASFVGAAKVNGSDAAKALTVSQLSDGIIMKEYEKRFGKDLKRDADQALLGSGGPPDKKPFLPEKDKMQYLLNELSSTKIASEEDASLALQVSNNLTQALLSYRLNSMG